MKKKTGHTPGPWAYHFGRGANPRFHIQTVGGYQIASTTELVRQSQAWEENAAREANARLIASAPELLTFVKHLYDTSWKSADEIMDFIQNNAEDIIDKAEGK